MYPPVGNLSAFETHCRYGGVVNRKAADECRRVCPAGREKIVNRLKVVLTVGIDLQNMGETEVGRHFKPRDDGSAFSAVDGVMYGKDAVGTGRNAADFTRARGVRRIIRQEYRQPLSSE